MKEKYFKDELDGNGPGRLRVYPHAPENMPDFVLAALGYVETCCVPEAGAYSWSVRLNIAYDGALDRQESSELSAALARCWRWIDTGEWKKAELVEKIEAA